jgi:predicted phosphodiesterase
MRIYALSDIHVDYEANARWVNSLSTSEHLDDVLILAGDVSDSLKKLDWCLNAFVRRFFKVLFVPGNHDLWVIRDERRINSLEKFQRVRAIVEQCGASIDVFCKDNISIVPLLGWYDYSFGAPGEELERIWMDYNACRWPAGWDPCDITAYFLNMNCCARPPAGNMTISFSHFLPRIDLMPWYIPLNRRILYPVLGTTLLETQVRELGSAIHIYGHSHVNRNVNVDGTVYINNAFGYPHEAHIADQCLKCVHTT